jgi:hypothetical protein
MKLKYLAIFCCLSLGLGLIATENTSKKQKWKIGTPIVTYWAGPGPITDKDAKQMAEGGFNVAIVYTLGKTSYISLVDFIKSQLSTLHKYGIRALFYLPSGGGLRGKDKLFLDVPKKLEEMNNLIEGIKDHPALYGYIVIDEPHLKDFKRVARVKEYLSKRDPGHLAWVNLLPNYASAKQLETEGNRVDAYNKYVKEYLGVVKPQLLSFDHYNFATNGQNDAYFLNLAQIRESALKENIPFMAILQASTWSKNYAIPTGEQLRWLAYTSLAYGSQGIMWYVYGHSGHDGAFVYPKQPDEYHIPGTLYGGEPTPLYYFVKEELHKDFVNIAKELQALKSVGVYHAGMIPEGTIELPKNNPFKLEPAVKTKACPGFIGGHYKDHNGIYPVNLYKKPLEGFVIGCFGKNNEADYALIVNLDYRTYGGAGQERRKEFKNPAKREIVGPGPLEVFDARNGKWYDAKSNRVKLQLPPGGGVLVRTRK